MKNHQPSHKHIQALLAHYQDWDAQEQAMVETHIATCATCAQQLADNQAIDSLLQGLPLKRPTPAVREQFYEAIAPTPKRWFQGLGSMVLVLNQVGAVALLVLMVAGIFLTIRTISQPHVPAAPSSDITSYTLDNVFSLSSDNAHAITLNSAGQLLAVATDGDLQIWNLSKQTIMTTIPVATPHQTKLQFTNTQLVAISPNGGSQAWRIADGWELPAFQVTDPNLVAIGQSLGRIVTVDGNWINIINLSNGDTIYNFEATVENLPIKLVATNPATHRILVADAGGIVYLFDNRGNLLQKMPTPIPTITQLALSQDTHAFTSVTSDNTAQIWTTTDGALIQTMPMATHAPKHLLLAGETMLAVGKDGRITGWEIETGEQTREYAGIPPFTHISPLVFPATGFMVATLSDTGVNVWAKPPKN